MAKMVNVSRKKRPVSGVAFIAGGYIYFFDILFNFSSFSRNLVVFLKISDYSLIILLP